MKPFRGIDFQTKIVLVLVAVIVPTFLIVVIFQNKMTKPLLEQELRQLGVTTGEALAAQIAGDQLFQRADAAKVIEREILEKVYYQPSIIRGDVFQEVSPGVLKFVASSIEEGPNPVGPSVSSTDVVTSDLMTEDEHSFWRILVPIRQKPISRKAPSKVLGVVHLLVSNRSVDRALDTLWWVTGVGAAVSVVTLIFTLNYFLRKTIANEKRLRQAENQNIQLSEQLHDVQRKIMNFEKLAAMGQLTANFAHEIGTPLNAIGGHLQLLQEELTNQEHTRPKERAEIIGGELERIEKIVKGFLHTTTKPESQRQLVDLNSLLEKTFSIVKPRIEAIDLDFRFQPDRRLGPVRVVPTDLEQIFLNLANNALDSLKTKWALGTSSKLELTVATEINRIRGEDWAEISFHDTGVGIKRSDLKNISKPFFTTKAPGEGTGLGLAISQELAGKYGGVLEIKSKEGAWAKILIRVPYRANV